MATLKDSVLDIIKDFVARDVLFTALDVSNLVKKTMPFARHKEVRDVVREAWTTHIDNNNYDRTPINVVLANGGTAEALLYHPLSASWDLDNLYGAQQRAQTAANPNTASIQTVAGTISKATDGTLTVTATPVPVIAPIPTPPAPTNTVDLWNQMWQTAPSLFPRKP